MSSKDARDVLRTSLDNGVNFFDTADVYGDGRSEQFVGELIKSTKEKKSLNFDIEVDGGINFENSKSVINAGANILVSGTTIFKSNNGDIKKILIV